jgi:starvation-inducible DNA-binding protein
LPQPLENEARDAQADISRLLHAHEIVLKEARAMARRAAEAGDDGTNDLIAPRQAARFPARLERVTSAW